MSDRFSVIIPTRGRRSLGRTLESIRNQPPAEGDEVLLIGDGAQPLAREILERSGLPGRFVETAATADYGGTQRNLGLELARGDYVLFMDDDDVYTRGAFARIRAILAENPDRPHLFRMRYASSGKVLWSTREAALGNISTQMIVFPNRSDFRPWDSEHGHDHRFVVDNLSLWPADSLVWREEIVALIRPHEAPRDEETAARDPLERPLAPGECPFREIERGASGIARCRLLEHLSGVVDRSICQVADDACAACCRSFPPTEQNINPVVGSMLYSLTEDVLKRGGVAGCSAEKAVELQAWAERSL